MINKFNNLNPFNEVFKGLEKEALRVNSQGELANTPHPKKLGSALTHPAITTDFSEALLEFVTPVKSTTKDVLENLQSIQNYVLKNINKNEFIWPSSMPSILGEDHLIPVAQYGKSNIGRLKTVYRKGLGHRYGRSMQTIAGIHYNFSVSDNLIKSLHKSSNSKLTIQDFQTQKYLGLIRNFSRYEWLLIYLFGACPVVDKSFLKNKEHKLQHLHKNTYYLPFATSLRMSNLGYTSSAQENLHICYNSIEYYLTTLSNALTYPFKEYENIKGKNNGQYEQINSNLLQIENEFYSTIRPKRVVNNNERPLTALHERGIEYVEVRLLDINPSLELGINQTQIDFIDSFLLFCLLEDSPQMSDQECKDLKLNRKTMVEDGLRPGQTIRVNDEDRPVKDYGNEILNKILVFCGQYSKQHEESVSKQLEKIQDVSKTPAKILLNKIIEQNCDYSDYILEQSKKLKETSIKSDLDQSLLEDFKFLANKSHLDQETIEKNDTLSFCDYLEKYNNETPKIILGT